jgi:hypothetical protein
LESVLGDCQTCQLGPNASLVYDDEDHPLRPTRKIDGRGVWTDYVWNEDGQLESRIDASNDPFSDPTLPRTTKWLYDSNFPAFPTSIEGPFTGASGSRVTTYTYDPATGDLLSRTQIGEEATYDPPSGAFALTTDYDDYTPTGRPEIVDPPGFSTTDRTTMTYDGC